jgi:hypothetical protein
MDKKPGKYFSKNRVGCLTISAHFYHKVNEKNDRSFCILIGRKGHQISHKQLQEATFIRRSCGTNAFEPISPAAHFHGVGWNQSEKIC